MESNSQSQCFQKLVKATINSGLELLIVNARLSALALAIRDAHFLLILFEAKKAGKNVVTYTDVYTPSHTLTIDIKGIRPSVYSTKYYAVS